MDFVVRNAIASLMIPPGVIVLLGLVGVALLRRRPRLGRLVLVFSLVSLYALSISLVADRLLQALEPVPADPLKATGAQAIVVLGGGVHYGAPEYGGHTVISSTLVRLRYAARLYRATGKPVLVTGGDPSETGITEATAMKSTLNEDFGVPVRWLESRSHTTLENARFSHEILERENIRSVYLVTQAWHMPRSQLAFEHAGFAVIPAATEYAISQPIALRHFIPDAKALRNSGRFFHEILGIVWYRLKFWF